MFILDIEISDTVSYSLTPWMFWYQTLWGSNNFMVVKLNFYFKNYLCNVKF